MAGIDKKSLLIRALQDYAGRQKQCIKDLRCGDLSKLQEWTVDMRWTLGKLKQLFVEVQTNVGVPLLDAGKMRAEALAVFERIKSQEKEMNELATGQFRQLGGQIRRLRRGKTALQGYSLGPKVVKARFLSGNS